VTTFQPGDRVAERPKSTAIIGVRPESREIVSKNRSQRYGTVLDVFYKNRIVKNVVDARITPALIKEAMQMQEEGATMRAIAEHFKFSSKNVIPKWIKRVQEEGEAKAFSPRRIVQDPYVTVQWDHLKSPSVHAHMRLCFESELAELQSSHMTTLDI